MSRIACLLLAIGTASVGYSQTAPPTAGRAAPAAVGASSSSKPAAAASGADQDRRVEAAIRTKLAKSKIGADGFTFHVQNGIVTWEGSTSVPQHKGAATRMAKTAGAAAVVNNIRVSGTKSGDNAEPRRAQVKPGSTPSH